MERSKSGFYLILLYLVLAVYLLPLYSNEGSADDLTRWATTASLVEKNSFEISWLKEIVGEEFADVTTLDNGNTYSNKPPGITFLSAPFYAIVKVIFGTPSRENLLTSWSILRFLIASIPLIILALWLYGMEVDTYSLAVLLFATPLFPYSLLYYSHVFVAILVYFAFRLIYDTRRVFPERCFTAGLLTGFAFLCEYTAVVPLVVFGLGLAFTESRERFRRMLFYTSGVAPFFFILAIFNQLVFGSPFATFYHYELDYPTLSGFYELLISPARGLFFFSPVLIFSLLAVFDSQERGFKRQRVKFITVILTILAICGFGSGYGGPAVSARHLIIVVPLLLDSFFDGEAEDFPSVFRGLLIAVSFLFCVIPILTFPFAPGALDFPHNSFWQPLLYDQNLYTLTVANTLGFENNIWTILPAMVLLLLAVYVVWRDVKYPFRFAVGIVMGFLIVAGYMFIPKLESKKAGPIVEKLVAERPSNPR